ncbi:hypothetical protein NG54_05475 [Heyndrickxia ginsengihumi]|uniref:RNase H type-1 domain-containing protein n=1 Tax=Heyndrickxia ginsengihumi TaxID=363870 RepID=A0A0A6Y190_9BACI|nr:reverse transcriptase-like protein [Heyndrickxia ginsengihumi]KHD86067.1 hypothetical protein NG54_05475 [Heyndrickxia ginsengihumi]
MKVSLKWKYDVLKAKPVLFQSEWTTPEMMERLIADIQKTGRVVELAIIDEMENGWTVKEFLKWKEEIEEEPSNIVVYFDGGFDLQTKRAGIGVVIYYQQHNATYRIRINHLFNELCSNSEAEYVALYFACQQLEDLGAHHVPCMIKGDAQGVIMQLLGEWPCYEEILNDWLNKIEDKLKMLGIKATYETISRKQNKEADQLASQALHDQMIHSHVKIEN